MLATSVPPILPLYLGVYRAVTAWSLRALRRHEGVRAVYLRRGGAQGQIVPLVSDIDFAVIGGPFDETERRSLHEAYDRIARTTTLLDRTLEVYTEDELTELFTRNDYFRYRLVEGKATWKLLYSRDGRDPVASLPDIAHDRLYGGFANEIKVWWSLFAWRFFHDRKYNPEAVTRNSFCFKTMSETLKMDLALTKDTLTFDRRDALKRALPDLAPAPRALGERLLRVADRRYRGNEPGILGETHAFLLAHLDRLYARLGAGHELTKAVPHASAPGGRVTQRVEAWQDDSFHGPREREHKRTIDEWIEREWGADFARAARLSPSAYLNLDEFAYFVPIDPESPPSVEQVSRLNRFHQSLSPDLHARFRIYLRTPEAAFQIDTEDLEQSWQSVLTPHGNPEVFEILDGPDENRPAWTRPVAHFLSEEKFLFYDLIAKPSIYKLGDRDFLRIFWKTAQLALLNRSAATGEVVYALTVPSLVRALETSGTPLAAELHPLVSSYEQVVRAGGHGVADGPAVAPLVRDALAWLREIER